MKKRKTTTSIDYSKLTGVKRGRLTFVSLVGEVAGEDTRWLVHCSCGLVVERRAAAIYFGRVKSCGCFKTESLIRRMTTHGDCRSPEWRCWSNILNIQKAIRAGKIHGSDFTICRRWQHSYSAFLEDMGRRPHPKSRLRRIDLKKGFSKDNCFWMAPGPKAKI